MVIMIFEDDCLGIKSNHKKLELEESETKSYKVFKSRLTGLTLRALCLDRRTVSNAGE